MISIKDLDLDWFWLGFSCGVNSRKKIIESPNKIYNYGVQGVVRKPTAKQQVSYFIGLILGRRKITQNLNVVRPIQQQDGNPHKSKGNYLTLSLGNVETTRGATVQIPLYISNNRVDNRGFCGFQAKIQYNPSNLTLNSITRAEQLPSSFTFEYQHDTSTGIVLVQGVNSDIVYEDMVVGVLEFTVGQYAPAQNTVTLCGPSGTGQGSDLLTRINEELYYIMPLTLENGKISVDLPEEPKPPKEQIPPIGGPEDLFGPNTDFNYEFELDLGYIGNLGGGLGGGGGGGGGGGSGSGGGASMIVTITFGDGSKIEVEIPLQEGNNKYKGKIPLKLPGLKKGPIKVDYYVKPNNPDDMYYYFIKAGALWGFETEVPREEAGQIPIKIPVLYKFDSFILRSGFKVYLDEKSTEPDTPTPPTLLTDLNIGGNLAFYSNLGISTYKELSKSDNEDLAFEGSFAIVLEEKEEEIIIIPDKVITVEDALSFADNLGISTYTELNKEDNEDLGFTGSFIVTFED